MTIVQDLVSIAAILVIVNQVGMWRTKSRMKRAAEHFEKASGALEDYVRKVQADVVTVMKQMREAAYQAQIMAELREDLRVSRDVPKDITMPMPIFRPKTPAQKARAAKGRTRT